MVADDDDEDDDEETGIPPNTCNYLNHHAVLLRTINSPKPDIPFPGWCLGYFLDK